MVKSGRVSNNHGEGLMQRLYLSRHLWLRGTLQSVSRDSSGKLRGKGEALNNRARQTRQKAGEDSVDFRIFKPRLERGDRDVWISCGISRTRRGGHHHAFTLRPLFFFQGLNAWAGKELQEIYDWSLLTYWVFQ